jgi:tetratricopeptide (TPR) repeat protein
MQIEKRNGTARDIGLARSIHATWRHLEELARTDFTDRALRRKRMERVREQLERKHEVKAQVWRERHHDGTTIALVDPDTVPIHVHDESAFVHYPASVADLRAVMRLLPPGTLNGLTKIVLCAGKEYQRERVEPNETHIEVDAFIGRIGFETLPGNFGGRLLGTYLPGYATIRLYAYVYERSIPDREMRELYLRLQMLNTFMHEVAHHREHQAYGARGRWLDRPEHKSELYAKRAAFRWTQQCVVPYLEWAYSEPAQALRAWIAQQGGVALPLSKLVDEPGQLFFYTTEAVEELARAVDAQEPVRERRLAFARDLHYADLFDEALESVAAVLVDHPGDAEALTLQADIYEHQEHYDEAERVARAVVSEDAAYEDAWEVLIDVYQARGDWQALEEAASRLIALPNPEGQIIRSAHWDRARARIELGDFEPAIADLAVFSQLRTRLAPHKRAVLQAVSLLREGRYEEAFWTANEHLRRWHDFLPWRAELAAVRFEAAHRLERPNQAGRLIADDIAQLRRRGYWAWMDRLTVEYQLGHRAGGHARARKES